jgi:chorismate dehydratase
MSERHFHHDKPLRIGAVSYLNTKPLVFGLRGATTAIDLVFDLPSRLADELQAERLDVALIPSIEFLGQPSYTIVSDACIACRGPVLSVKLLSRVPTSEIRTLAVDEGSRTSGILARILLFQRYGLRPQLESFSLQADLDDCQADAVLLIGDRAIHPSMQGFVDSWDLGDQWCRWSELPFVFAMWVARSGVDVTAVGELLNAVRDAGLANLERIAGQEADGVHLGVDETLGYLRDNLHFHLGARERSGLNLYYQLAARIGAVSTGAEQLAHACNYS